MHRAVFCLTLLSVCSFLARDAQAAINTFGSGANTFQMEFVPIGSTGNAADTTGNPNPAGAVGYAFNMGKYEVSEDMINKANALGGLGITIDARGTDKPATGVSWNEAARFVNWLNTSQGYAPAYKFALQPGDVSYFTNANIQLWASSDLGFDASNPFRNSLANYVLPSLDEWYKAAYYDPHANGGLGGYWDYPTGSNTAPLGVASGVASGTAVFANQFFQGPADIMQAGGLSPFGTMGQGGNVREWQETEFDLVNNSTSALRGVRGGRWSDGLSSGDATSLSSASLINQSPGISSNLVGFRVASLSSPAAVPEPGSLVIWSMIGLGGLLVRGRRVRK